MIKTVCFTWLWIHCQLSGPAISNEWDLTKDGVFDLRDVAEIQNGWVDNRYRFCCIDEDCSSEICRSFGL